MKRLLFGLTMLFVLINCQEVLAAGKIDITTCVTKTRWYSGNNLIETMKKYENAVDNRNFGGTLRAFPVQQGNETVMVIIWDECNSFVVNK